MVHPGQIAIDLESSIEDVNESNQNSVFSDLDLDSIHEQPEGKVLKGAMEIAHHLFGRENQSSASPSRSNIVEPDLNRKRPSISVDNYQWTFDVKMAHRMEINSICELKKGLYATCSDDKSIKIWMPFKTVALGSLEEDAPVKQMVVIHGSHNLDLVYAASSVLSCLSLKQGKSFVLCRNDRVISALTTVEQNPHIVCFGLENGVIKDYDLQSRNIVRSQTLH